MAAEGHGPVADPAGVSPAQARKLFTQGLVTPTAGWCRGFTQANVIIVPRDFAYDVLLFAQRNPQSCPLLEVLDAGDTSGRTLAGDIRTAIPKYTVYVDGDKSGEPTDIARYWRTDLVTFIIGCSFTFEAALQAAGIPIAHIDSGTNVPMYVTDRRCAPAGRLSGPLIVSMRPIPADRVADAVTITASYPAVHGAPVHVGAPDELGIDDLSSPDFGDAVDVPEGHMPVFWACGVTPQAAVMESRPPLAISHSPGHMLITDAHDRQFRTP